jgi:hypothetical protein
MSELKTKDGKPKPEPTCYEVQIGGLGINFELLSKIQLFAHTSFLSHVQMNGDEAISIHYTFGVVRVLGHHLQDVYRHLKEHHICIIRRSKNDDPCRPEIEVTSVIFETADGTVIDGI